MECENLKLGRALLAELREVFGAVVWLDAGLVRFRYPEGYTPFEWDLAFIKDHRVELIEALRAELKTPAPTMEASL